MIKSILLATDGSYHAWVAWQYAVNLARAYGAWLRVLSVVDTRVLCAQTAASVGGTQPTIVDPVPSAELQTMLEAEQTQTLEEVRQKTELAGVKVETILALGAPADTICSNDSLVDLIALGHYGDRSALDRVIIGSVAEAVVRKSSRPVLIAPGNVSSIDRILAGYDGSEASRHALHWAADLATTMALPLDVVHINPDSQLGRMVMVEAEEYLKPYALQEVHTIVQEGDVVEKLLEAANEQVAGLIVMGAYGHNRLHKALLGSVTERMMQETQTPLLMTR